MPDGKLHILTARTGQSSTNTSTSGVITTVPKSGTPKVLAQAASTTSHGTLSGLHTPIKSAVVVRQQANKPSPANVIVKTVAQKPTMQRVISYIMQRRISCNYVVFLQIRFLCLI